MAVIRREPTPPGPITDLFSRLDDLHSTAGRPSMREIAIRAGRGTISSSSVHNVFSKSKVPRWPFLEHIVRALGGDAEVPGAFHSLWDAAWLAENGVTAPQARSGQAALAVPQARLGNHSPEALTLPDQEMPQGPPEVIPRQAHRIRSNEIPSRNENFTGRTAELERLAVNLFGQEQPDVQVISGMGGIGKTELATEYIHRNINSYEIIWWIRAEHQDRVREALVRLGQRLQLLQATAESTRDRTVKAVLSALQSGPWSSWLLVFDNAADPLDLQQYIPDTRPGGHVIITARQPNWAGYVVADSVEVSPFTDAESISFLRSAVPSALAREGAPAVEDPLRISDAQRLATTLGNLPIALGHAAAYLAETRQSVEEYLTSFTENAHQLLSEQHQQLAEQPPDGDVPAPVSGTWAMSITLLSPDAEHLFNLCSFFSPEPIARALLQARADGIDDPPRLADVLSPPGLADVLSSPSRLDAAAAQLRRLSLARFDGAHDLIQVHRVVQAVTQGRLRLHRHEAFLAYRGAADTLLALSNPGNPDHGGSDQVYDLSLQHLESDHRFLRTGNPALRALIIDQVRRLHLRGGHVEAMRFGQDALQVWQERLGPDDLQVLALSVEVAIAMYLGNHTHDAHELIRQIRPLLQRYTEGVGFRTLLLCENIYGAILRTRGQFGEALTLDQENLGKFEHEFTVNHELTLNARSNVAVDYRLLGRLSDALKTDERTYQDRRRVLGPEDTATLASLNAVARDMRGLGLYRESLDKARQAVNAFEAVSRRENIPWLHAQEGFATALRKAGHHWNAQDASEQVLQRYRDYLGADHMYTLRAAADLINAWRAVGNLDAAEELARQTHDLCLASDAPNVLLNTVLLNLASVYRAAGHPDAARRLDDQARKKLIQTHGDRHPFTLSANINYASDLAACGNLGEAIRLGIDTLGHCGRLLGGDHPDTLMAAANLASDETAWGDRAAGDDRLAQVLRGYERTLTLEHPEAQAAALGTRLTAEIEPYDL